MSHRKKEIRRWKLNSYCPRVLNTKWLLDHHVIKNSEKNIRSPLGKIPVNSERTSLCRPFQIARHSFTVKNKKFLAMGVSLSKFLVWNLTIDSELLCCLVFPLVPLYAYLFYQANRPRYSNLVLRQWLYSYLSFYESRLEQACFLSGIDGEPRKQIYFVNF